MELQIDEPLETEAPYFDLLPDLMIANVTTEVDLDRPSVVLMGGRRQGTGLRRCDGLGELLLLENKQELTGMHD